MVEKITLRNISKIVNRNGPIINDNNLKLIRE